MKRQKYKRKKKREKIKRKEKLKVPLFPAKTKVGQKWYGTIDRPSFKNKALDDYLGLFAANIP